MLSQVIYGWQRIGALSGKHILIYADCRKQTNILTLDHILAELIKQNNMVYVFIDGNFIMPAYAQNHVSILSAAQIKTIPAIDAAITLGKPRPEFLQALTAYPDLLFGASFDTY